MSLLPFLMAWYLKENPGLLQSRTNNGDLIIPPLVTERTDLTGIDAFSEENMKELKGRWVLVNVIAHADCNETCKDALHKSKQLLLMMGKDLTRIRRLAVVFNPISNEQANAWWRDDARLLKAKPNDELKSKLTALKSGPLPDGVLLLMDPFGNLMMQYEPGFDPYKVKSDLKKLLNISQIG